MGILRSQKDDHHVTGGTLPARDRHTFQALRPEVTRGLLRRDTPRRLEETPGQLGVTPTTATGHRSVRGQHGAQSLLNVAQPSRGRPRAAFLFVVIISKERRRRRRSLFTQPPLPFFSVQYREPKEVCRNRLAQYSQPS